MMSRVTRNTFKNIRRMPYQALSAVAVLTITFFVGQLFILLTLGSQKILTYFETRPQISAYFEDETLESDILALKRNFEGKEYVEMVDYISKEEALEIYREQNKEDELLLEMVTADILPASLEISAKSVDQIPTIKNELTGLPGIEEVVFQQDVVEALSKWTSGIRLVGLGLVVFLVATSMLIVVIIVGMKVASRRHEIGIMQLLGASRWFIVGPFLLEGAFYGVVGGFTSWVLSFIMLLYLTPFLVEFLGDIPLFPVDALVMILVMLASVVSGVLIGMAGSALAVKRYFK